MFGSQKLHYGDGKQDGKGLGPWYYGDEVSTQAFLSSDFYVREKHMSILAIVIEGKLVSS